MAEREHTITFTLGESDFEMAFDRLPRDDNEFDDWAYLCEKGLRNGHIDWNIVFECAKDAMRVNHGDAVLDSPPHRRREPRTVAPEDTQWKRQKR